MRVLMLGGGVFLGRALSREMLAKGWDLTCFTRGKSLPGPIEGAKLVHGDRRNPADLQSLATQDWDVVVDTCGYRPADLEAPLEALADRAGTWLFVSTISVYAPPYPERPDEDAATLAPVDAEAPLAEHYGALKAMCEDMVVEELEERALIVRPGLIVGPEDPSERFTWWVRELAKGGSPVWPDAARQPFQWIDVRDLAQFCCRLLEIQAMGFVHVAGPANPPRLPEALARMQAVLAPGQPGRALPEQAFHDLGIRPWSELPLWLPESEYAPFNLDLERALGAGLTLRSLEETTRDALAWLREHAPEGRGPLLADLAARLSG